MKVGRRSLAAHCIGLWVFGLVGCAQPRLVSPDAAAGQTYWRGRLSLRVQAPQLAEPTAAATSFTSYYADFELSGRPQAGVLYLSSPLGTTLAQLRWEPGQAWLTSEGHTRAFESLDALAIEATGAAIPIAALYQWLRGEPVVADGWQVDLSRLSEGRVLAQRRQPAPAAELRLILDQP